MEQPNQNWSLSEYKAYLERNNIRSISSRRGADGKMVVTVTRHAPENAKRLVFYPQGASDIGESRMPREILEALGCEVFRQEYSSFLYCVLVEVDKIPDGLPSCFSVAGDKACFRDEL